MFVVLWIGFAVVVGVAAGNRGRNGVGWGMLAIIISPLLAGLLLLAMPPLRDPFKDITTLAAIETTPEGSRSRRLLAEHETKLLAEQHARLTDERARLDYERTTPYWDRKLWRYDAPRRPAPRLSAPRLDYFRVLVTVWAVLLVVAVLAGVGIVASNSQQQAAPANAVRTMVAPKVEQSRAAPEKHMSATESACVVMGMAGHSCSTQDYLDGFAAERTGRR